MPNVWLLALAQALAGCGTIMLITFGGIVGTHLAPTPALATLPLSLSVLGVAISTVPAALLMQRIGRRPAFIGAALAGAIAALVCAWATASASFVLLCAGGLLNGSSMAYVLQFRFAATEYVEPANAGHAISTVMLGTLAAAVLAPEVGDAARQMGGWPEFTGTFVALAGLDLAGAAVLWRLATAPAPKHRAMHAEAPRRIRHLLRTPAFVVAVLASLTSYAAMSLIMTATPISMHVLDGLSLEDTKRVITGHLLAMYLPSLASGALLRWIGLERMMVLGVLCMLACVAVAVTVDHHFVHYFGGLALLGIGWNFLFVAGTALLTTTCSAAERFRAQGFNDLVTFGSQAVASLLAGTALQSLGWGSLNLASVPLLAAMLAAIAWMHLHGRGRVGAAARGN